MHGDELVLKGEMDRSFLIQRLTKPHGKLNPFAFGGGLINGGLSNQAANIVKNIFAFDYMGSAEFEYGAVRAAFKFVADQASKPSQIVCGTHMDVYYICPKPYEEGVKKLISKLLENEYGADLKEYCGLKDSMSQKTNYTKSVGWIELDNGFFFFTDSVMYENTKSLFGIVSANDTEKKSVGQIVCPYCSVVVETVVGNCPHCGASLSSLVPTK
jgi:hypothetical protein